MGTPVRSVALICACLALGLGAASASGAGWPAPEDVFGPSQSITNTPQVALDAAGNAVATGMRDVGGGDILVEAVERPAGGGWSESVVLSDPDEEEPTSTQVAVDAAGNAIAVWGAWVEPGYSIQTASRPAGGEWSEPEPLGGLVFLGARPHLAMNADGDAVVTWSGFDGGEVVIAAVRTAGGEWSEPETISAEMEEGTFSQVGIDAEGDAIAVWQQINPGENVVRAATRPAGGEWSEPEDLSAAGDNATAPRIAVDPAGDAVAVWSVVGGDVGVLAKTRPADGDWSEQEDVSAEGEVVGEPEVAIDFNGAVATWTASVGDDQIMRGAVRPAGAEEWSAPEDVSSPVDQFRSTDLETNPTAGAIAIWTRFDEGPGNSVQASVRPPGGEWSDPEDVSAEGQEAGLADLAFDPAGDSIALWGAKVTGGFIVQASGYDFFAPRLDGVLIPASGKVGEPVTFAVSPFDFFPLGAASWSFGDGSSASGNTVSHVYSAPGAHPVTVSGVDGGGNTSTRTAAIAIAGPPDPPPPPRLTSLFLRIGKKSLPSLRRSGALAVTVTVDSAASATLNGRVRLRAQGKARPRLVPIFVRKTIRFAAAGKRTVQLTLSERGRKALRPLTKARIRIEGEASDLAGGTVTDSAARTLRD